MQLAVTNYHYRDAVGAGRFRLAQLAYGFLSLNLAATDRLLQRLSGHTHPTGTAILKLGASGKTTLAFTHPIPILVQLNQN